MKHLLLILSVCLLTACPKKQPLPSPSPTPSPTSTVEPSPAPTPEPSPTPKQLLFGYYFASGKYGDHFDEVSCYTNLYYIVVKYGYGSSEDSDDVWIQNMKSRVKQAFNKGKKLHLNMSLGAGDPIPVDRVLETLKPFWSQVSLIELADEPSWSKEETQIQITNFRKALDKKGLEHRPIGIVYTQKQTLEENAIMSRGLDWVGIEAYVDPPGSNNSQENVRTLNKFITAAKNRIPQSKNIVIVMQAYDRNGAWKNIETLKALQEPAYLASKDDPRVLALTMFAYSRPSGTREYPALKEKHIKMGNEIMKKNCSL